MSLTSTASEFLVRFATNGNSNNGVFYKGDCEINIFEGTINFTDLFLQGSWLSIRQSRVIINGKTQMATNT